MNSNRKIDALFVCVHNAGRSQMAEALFNHLASEQNLDLHAASAGTIAGETINPMAKLAMEEIGISMDQAKPKQLTQEMVESTDRIISMGCGVDVTACPARFLVTEDWGLDDPANQPIEKVRVIRDDIRERVLNLLSELRGSVGEK